MSNANADLQEKIQSSVRRATGIHALRALGKLVKQSKDEELANAVAVRRIFFSVLALFLMFVLWAFLTTPRVALPEIAQTEGASNRMILETYASSIRKLIDGKLTPEFKRKLTELNATQSLALTLNVNNDGQLDEVIIQTPSGNPLLDDLAIRLVKSAAPFPPIPFPIRTPEKFLKVGLSISPQKD